MKYKPYTKKELDFLYRNRTLTRHELTAAFNKKFNTSKTVSQIKPLCTRKGYLTGRTGCFKKGHTSWNTDTKGLTSANITSVKKGKRPKNWLPVGSEIISSYGDIKVKVGEPNKWKFKHKIIWETAHGKIERYVPVIFKDGAQLNCELENLEMVSRQVLLYLNRNGYKELPGELQPTILAIATLECKTYALAK